MYGVKDKKVLSIVYPAIGSLTNSTVISLKDVGFSQERPAESIIGELHFVQDIKGNWHYGYIANYNGYQFENGKHPVPSIWILLSSVWPLTDDSVISYAVKSHTKDNPFLK